MPQQPRLDQRYDYMVAAFRGGRDPARNRGENKTLGMDEVVRRAIRAYRLGGSTPEHVAADHWSSLVGPSFAERSHPVTVDSRGRLVVATANGVVHQELFLRRRQILAALRNIEGLTEIRDITFRAG